MSHNLECVKRKKEIEERKERKTRKGERRRKTIFPIKWQAILVSNLAVYSKFNYVYNQVKKILCVPLQSIYVDVYHSTFL